MCYANRMSGAAPVVNAGWANSPNFADPLVFVREAMRQQCYAEYLTTANKRSD